jgi:hypothetical protein
MSKKLTTELFIRKAKEIHGDKYNYSKISYINNHTKVCIICPEHGEFWQVPNSHLNGNGCNECCVDKRKKIRTLTNELFIEKARKIHGDKYNYSKVEYINSKTKVCIICPKHGEFWQEANSHLQGEGCKKCHLENKPRRMNTKKFIEKARKIHGDKYDYSKVEYISAKEKVCIICLEHGEFWQKPSCHLYGYGCPKCGLKKCTDSHRKTVKQFIDESEKVHGKKYDYSGVEYVNAFEKVKIICPKHGEFWQEPHNHLKGNGCPICRNSKLENIVSEELKRNSINFVQHADYKIFPWLGKQHLDFFLPDHNIAIECQGEQHFTKYRFEKNTENLEKRKKLDLLKNKLCKDNKIKLIYFSNIPKYEMFLGEKITKNNKELIDNIYA